jgi:hypothetical protein
MLCAIVRVRDKMIQNRDKSAQFSERRAGRLRGVVFLLRLRALPALRVAAIVGMPVAVYVRLEFIREVV